MCYKYSVYFGNDISYLILYMELIWFKDWVCWFVIFIFIFCYEKLDVYSFFVEWEVGKVIKDSKINDWVLNYM